MRRPGTVRTPRTRRVNVVPLLLLAMLAFFAAAPGRATQAPDPPAPIPRKPNPAAAVGAESDRPRSLPNLTLLNLDGETVPLREFRGSVVLLDFWATDCKPCLKRMPHFEKLQKSRRSAGLVVLGASIDPDMAPVQKFMEARRLTYPVLLDLGRERARQVLAVQEIPTTFLVNRAGLIIRRWNGKVDHRRVAAAVDSLLAAEPRPAG